MTPVMNLYALRLRIFFAGLLIVIQLEQLIDVFVMDVVASLSDAKL